MENSEQIAVIGLDDFNREMLNTVRDAERKRFFGIIAYDEIVNPQSYPIEEFLHTAQFELEEIEGGANAIIGHWDFPTTSLLPILRSELGFAGPDMESVLMCEHKYGTRLAQAESTPELAPPFALVNPDDDALLDDPPLPYPFWLKPVIAFSSTLGFRVEGREHLRRALDEIRRGIGKFAQPFDTIKRRAKLGARRATLGGRFCIAEGLVSGRGCTLEGYVHNGECKIYGIVDSMRAENGVSFVGYHYPSDFPKAITDRMCEASCKLIGHIGLDDTPFNIEFLWNQENDDLKVLEINPRISKSHAPLFYLTEGASHHEVAIDIAMQREPNFPHGGGQYPYAAKFMPRTYDPARITRVPSQRDIERLQKVFPDAMFENLVKEGQELADLPNQDSYSFELGGLFLGGESREAVTEHFREAMRILDYRFSRNVETNYD